MFKRSKQPAVTEVVLRDVSRRDVVGQVRIDPGRVAGPGKVRRAVRRRRSVPLRGYIGPNGHGKSVCAVLDFMPSLERGRRVLSTTELLDWKASPDLAGDFVLDDELGLWVKESTGVAWRQPLHPAYVRLTEWSQLMAAENCDILLDDVAGVASSRQSSGMPAAIEKLLQKLRHADITLAWTAPSWGRADIIIRECTQLVTIAKGSRPIRSTDGDREWLQNRQFEWTSYDAAEYTDWTEGKKDKARRVATQRFYGPGSDVFKAYNSLGRVDTITSVTDAGRCVSCGGTRRAPGCSCPEYLHAMEERSTGRSAGKRSAGATEGERSPAGRHSVVDKRPAAVSFAPRGSTAGRAHV